MVKEAPFAEGSIEWERCAAGGGSETCRGSLCEPCRGLIQSQGVPWDTRLDQTSSQHPTFPSQCEETYPAQLNPHQASTATVITMM